MDTTTQNPILVLLQGRSLSNPGTWKKIQNLINLLAGLSPLLALLLPQYAPLFTPELTAKLLMAVGAVNAYLTTATTGKIGL